MLILEAVNIKMNFGDREILSFEKLQIKKGDKIGVVGRNGAGKTTLLNILAGEQLPDEGIVKRFCEIAYIKQMPDTGLEADDKALSEFNVRDKVNKLIVSGGEHTRLKIAAALSRNTLLLFADEPTANLDLKGIEILRKKLLAAETLVLISHDRELLDSTCNKIIEVADGEITGFEGNYSFYEQRRQQIINRELFEYESYISEKRHLEEAVINRKARAEAIKKAPARMGNSEARLHRRHSNEMQEKIHGATKAAEGRLNKLEVKEKPMTPPSIRLDFSLTNPPKNNIIISGNNFSFGYGDKKLYNKAAFNVYNGKKQAIIGENGSGKTTLLNRIYSCFFEKKTNAFNAEENSDGINIVPKAEIGYFCQGLENLNASKTVLENAIEESIQDETTVRTVLARLLLTGDNVYKKVGVLSGGERIKVSFAKLIVSNANILILDEPTNYLDMRSIEALQDILSEYEGTVLFVSHDRGFVNAIAQRLLIIQNNHIIEFDGKLRDYENNMSKRQENTKTQKLLLQMRITEVLARLSKSDKNNERLENEYQELLAKLRGL
nr:ABC-F type ribosomal protection protein [Ruminiclostridium sufflavum]